MITGAMVLTDVVQVKEKHIFIYYIYLYILV